MQHLNGCPLAHVDRTPFFGHWEAWNVWSDYKVYRSHGRLKGICQYCFYWNPYLFLEFPGLVF